jgi:hypothetical protein
LKNIFSNCDEWLKALMKAGKIQKSKVKIQKK